MTELNTIFQRLKLSLLILIIVSASAPVVSQSRQRAQQSPILILISIDGCRSDYFKKFNPPNLRMLASTGVRAAWMTPCFPSKTFTNHYCIVTGLYPQHHGIVENSVYDRATKRTLSMSDRKEVQDGRWWLGEPIWITAAKQGQKTAPLFWPGSEAEIEGIRPTYWKPYDGKIPNEARVDLVLSWLDLPSAERPTFLTLYFNDVDEAGHEFSPDAPQTREAVLKVDKVLGRLIEGLKSRSLFDKANLIIVSDHGMTPQDPKNVIILDELFDPNLAEKVLWTSEIVSIFPAEGKEEAIYQALKAKLPPQARVFKKSELPPRYHYSDSPRIAPLIVLPNEGWQLLTRQRYEERKSKGQLDHTRGGHGYDNELPSMRATFIAHGPAFKKGIVLKPFSNLNVYNLMCRILKLKPAPNDGSFSWAAAALSSRNPH